MRTICAQDRIRLNGHLAMVSEVNGSRLSDDEVLAPTMLPAASARPRKLANLHTLPSEDRLEFDEATHTYKYDGCIVPRSVTSLVHEFASHFDPYSALAMMRSSLEWEDRRADFEEAGLGTTDEDFMQRWKTNGEVQRARGTLMHFHCECMVNDVPVDEPHSPEFQQAQTIYTRLIDMKLRPFRSELSLYNARLRCAGQADLVLLDEEDGLVIVDWKRTKQLVYENRFGALRYPLSHLPDTNYWHYALQLNLYAYFLESPDYSARVSDLYLAIAHPENTVPQVVKVPRLRAEVEAIVQFEIEHGRARA